jgi:6-hydroxynicotinate 3-monooxygenase
MSKLSVAIIGAGMGGLTAAATFRRAGIEVNVYEQAPQFARLGAGIQMSPNAMKVLRAIGLEDGVRAIAFQPERQYSREFDTGNINLDYPFGKTVEDRYGAPYLLMHRGDLHALLASTVPESHVHRGKKLVGFDQGADGVWMHFADGSQAHADVMVAADGVHSFVRQQLFGDERPHYSGRVAYRTTFPAALMKGETIDDCTKWWGRDRHIVIYYTTKQRDEIYFVTSVPESDWKTESWSAMGDLGELRTAFANFHPTVRMVLDACPQVHKWAILERDPMPSWGENRVVLIGDACHPMTPYMAQGAATAMEDAAVLSRLLGGIEVRDVEQTLKTFYSVRKERTAQIQLVSHSNTWLHRNANTDWVYGYDAWNVPLTRPSSAVA